MTRRSGQIISGTVFAAMRHLAMAMHRKATDRINP
jgi:hypothetical protein